MPAINDSFTPIEDTELFISLPIDEAPREDGYFDILITEAFSPFLRLTRFESPDFALETFKSELY